MPASSHNECHMVAAACLVVHAYSFLLRYVSISLIVLTHSHHCCSLSPSHTSTQWPSVILPKIYLAVISQHSACLVPRCMLSAQQSDPQQPPEQGRCTQAVLMNWHSKALTHYLAVTWQYYGMSPPTCLQLLTPSHTTTQTDSGTQLLPASKPSQYHTWHPALLPPPSTATARQPPPLGYRPAFQFSPTLCVCVCVCYCLPAMTSYSTATACQPATLLPAYLPCTATAYPP